MPRRQLNVSLLLSVWFVNTVYILLAADARVNIEYIATCISSNIILLFLLLS